MARPTKLTESTCYRATERMVLIVWVGLDAAQLLNKTIVLLWKVEAAGIPCVSDY
jgi:hypothetical protein